MSMTLASGARRSFPVPASFARSGRFLVMIVAAAGLAVLFLS